MDKEIMNHSAIKNTAKNNIKSQFNFNRNVSNIGIIAIQNPDVRDFIIEGISQIGLAAVVVGSPDDLEFPNVKGVDKLNQNALIGFDFFVYDNEHEGLDVVKCMGAGIVPIMPTENTYSGMIKDFNPMRFEGNGFLWKGDSKFCIFEKIISYLENIKFPEDKRTLIKNVTSTF